jgi:histidinol-phosphate phosphatase family protein
VEDFELLSGAIEGIKYLNQYGFKTIVITNQSGIARGYFTENTLAEIHQKMKQELAIGGASLDAIYYCPHHPDEHCACRKPRTKLIRQALVEHHIDIASSFVIGDRLLDIQLARNIGCKAVLIDNERGRTEVASNGMISADFVAVNLFDACKWILGSHLSS